MKPFTTLAAAAGALLLLAGCNVNDAIYHTSHPTKGTILLTTQWSGIGEGLTVPSAYTVKAGDFSTTLSSTTATLDYLFEPGKCPISVYNTPEHITVSGTTATVDEAAGNAEGAGKFVYHAPDWLFTSATEAVIQADAVNPVTAVMQQQVRELTLFIEPTGGTLERISDIVGYLTGAAGTLDFAAGTYSTPMNVELQFEKVTDGDNAGKWRATVRLLGVAGTQQKLYARIHFEDDTPKMLPLENDLTTELAAFNADKRNPLVLGGKVVETPTEAGFSATINGWTPVTGSGTAD